MNEFDRDYNISNENNENNENHLVELAHDIVKMTDSVIGVIGKITTLSSDDYQTVKEWYEQLVGHEFNIVRDAVDVRKNAISYLKSKNIYVPDDPTYDVEQYNPMNTLEFFKNWNGSDIDSSKKR